MTEEYLAIIPLIERLHRHFLNVVKLELECSDIRDTNNVQAIMLFNLGDAEMTVGELTLRGCYLGSNVSYNLKKLVEGGYIHHARSEADRRSVLVRLTTKGELVRDMLRPMLKVWLDDNLPPLVERLVRNEIERVARGRP